MFTSSYTLYMYQICLWEGLEVRRMPGGHSEVTDCWDIPSMYGGDCRNIFIGWESGKCRVREVRSEILREVRSEILPFLVHISPSDLCMKSSLEIPPRYTVHLINCVFSSCPDKYLICEGSTDVIFVSMQNTVIWRFVIRLQKVQEYHVLF